MPCIAYKYQVLLLSYPKLALVEKILEASKEQLEECIAHEELWKK